MSTPRPEPTAADAPEAETPPAAPAPPSMIDTARAAAEKKAAEAAVAGVVTALGKVADGALDAVETFLFGKVGGAEAAIRKDAALSPLDRLRAEAGEPPPPPPAPPKEDPVEVARRQLEALKAARAAPPPERKKTL